MMEEPHGCIDYGSAGAVRPCAGAGIMQHRGRMVTRDCYLE
jgi:hypothetical protein